MLHLREEALVLAPSDGSGPPADLNDEAPVHRSEPMLGSNPTVSNVHTVIYSLFTIFHQFSRGTLLSLPRPPYDQFPYSLASPVDAYAQGLRRMLVLPPLMSEFVGMAGYAPTSFHDLMDGDVESEGFSIGDVVAPSHPLS